MKFKLDENLPVETAVLLSDAGHDALTVLDQALGGEPDQHIASVCRDETRILITLDLDFSDIRTYAPAQFPGIIVLRLKQQARPHILATMRRVVPMLIVEPIAGKLWIVDEDRIRIRD